MTTKKVKMKVNGIHCNGCANKIKNGMTELNIGAATEVDVATGEVRVTFDGDKGSLGDIKNKISATGYSVEGVELE